MSFWTNANVRKVIQQSLKSHGLTVVPNQKLPENPSTTSPLRFGARIRDDLFIVTVERVILNEPS